MVQECYAGTFAPNPGSECSPCPRGADCVEAGVWGGNVMGDGVSIFLVKLQRPHTTSHQKVAVWKGIPLISGKSRLVKYYNLARYLAVHGN